MARVSLRLGFPGEHALGPGKVRILELIGETGSISAAGRAMKMSYRRAWMLVDKPYSTLEVSVGWSRNRTAPKELVAPARLNRNTALLISSAATQLKARAPREDFDLEGYVVQLDSDDAARGGCTVVLGDVDEGARRVRMKLDGADYQHAVEAHGRMARVSCSGRLTKDGRQYELRAPRDFTVLGDE